MGTKKQTNLGLVSMILGFVGISTSFMCIGIIPCIISIVFGVLGLCETNRSKGKSITGLVCSSVGLIIFIVVILLIGTSDTSNNSSEETVGIVKETESETESETEPETELETYETTINPIETEPETERSISDYSEEEYKEMCCEIWYNEVFLGKDNLEDQYVKLHLMFSEKYFFTADDLMYSDSTRELFEEYNLYRDFYKCCVLREGTNSYVGQSINVLFSQNIQLNPSNYETGQKVVMYGKIIHYNTNTWDGYNTVYFIPKYIELE